MSERHILAAASATGRILRQDRANGGMKYHRQAPLADLT